MTVKMIYSHAREHLATLWDQVEDSREAAVIQRRGHPSSPRAYQGHRSHGPMPSIGSGPLTVRPKRARVAVTQAECLEELRYWGDTNRKTALRVLDVLEAALRNPTEGIGKPQHLKHFGGNAWSRRINEADRLVYEIFADRIAFLQARYHHG